MRTGRPVRPVNQEGAGGEFFREFVEDLYPVNEAAAEALARELDLGREAGRGPAKVLDVAAGSGVWGIAFAKRSPAVRVTAVDWAGVLPVTRKVAQRHGVADRFEYVEGDILEADFGDGYRVATLGHILHSEGVERSRRLLERVFDALAPGGTVAVAEFVADEGRTGPPLALLFAVNMLNNTDEGDTFTFGEMSGWLREAGFGNVRQLQVPAPSPLVLADKPGAG